VKIILVALNAKFIHSSPAIRSLYACLSVGEKRNVLLREFTVNQSEDLIVSELFKLNPDILAFSCYIWNIDMVLSVIGIFKKIMPQTHIIAGGPEVSYEYGHLYELGVDTVVVGEGERAFREIVRGLTDGARVLPALYQSEPLALAEIPFPYESDFAEYENRIIYYETSRGCPNGCRFCLSSDEPVRYLPMERVKADLRRFIDAEVKQVKFVDRTFNCSAERAAEIWEYLIQTDNGTSNFHFEVCADSLTDAQIELLQTARNGLFQFEVGVQSTNPAVLREIRRNPDTGPLLANVRRLKALGNIHLHLDLIVGLPHEDYPSFARSFDDCMAVSPHMLQVGFLKLLKGCGLRADADKYGIIYHYSAPYEVLVTDVMDYAAVNKLKIVSHMVDLFYNSGKYACCLRYLTGKYPSPFTLFDALSEYWEARQYHLLPQKGKGLYAVLYGFGTGLYPSESGVFRELLKYDMLVSENIRTFPHFIADNYRYDPKMITKSSATHKFEYDIPDWLENEPGRPLNKTETYVTFKYRIVV
jgi:radical SAM superfamily enzyme YgiQ (UPF0313 family)